MADMLASPEELATFVQQSLDVYEAATAELALQLATGMIQATVGQRIVQVVDDEIVLDIDQYTSGPYLVLPEGPVTSVTAVSVGETVVTDHVTQLSRGRLWRALGWQAAGLTWPMGAAPGTVTVTYTHGYPAGDQRLQLARQCCLALASRLYENPSGATREQSDDYAVQYEAVASQAQITPAMTSALRRNYGRSGRSVLLVKSSS